MAGWAVAAALAAGALVIAGGCAAQDGADEGGVTSTAPPAGVPATVPAPPEVRLRLGPGAVALRPTGGCWDDGAGAIACGDGPAPRCDDPEVPRLTIGDARRAVVTSAVPPRRLTISVDGGPPAELAPSRSAIWTRPRPGLVTVALDAGARGRGEFVVCLTP